jgi:phosphate transport system substrate-binding protein
MFPLAAIAGPPDERLWAAPIGVDAIAVIVHAGNPLDGVTLSQLQKVFSGRVWRWSELGTETVGSPLADAEIVVISREEGSGTRAAFERLALRPRPDQDPAPVTTMAVLQLGSTQMVDYVAQHPAAIGYVALGVLEASEERASVKPLAIEGLVPGPKQISSGDYPLSLPLFLVAPSEPDGAARRFVDFCLGPAGQRIVALGYVPVRE